MLGFDHEPAFIAVGRQLFHDGDEIEAAIPRHGKRALHHRIQKAFPAAVQPVDHRHPHVLGMDMADAGVVLVDHPQHVAAGKCHVARVIQQGNAGTGMLHEQVQFGFRLDRRRHVVMIGQRHTLIGAPFAKRRHLAGISPDLVFIQFRLGCQWPGAVALHRPRGFAVNDARRFGGNEEIHLRADAVLFHLDIAVEQQTGKPAATHRHAITRHDRPQNRRIHRKPPAGFHAGKARLLRLAQAFL